MSIRRPNHSSLMVAILAMVAALLFVGAPQAAQDARATALTDRSGTALHLRATAISAVEAILSKATVAGSDSGDDPAVEARAGFAPVPAAVEISAARLEVRLVAHEGGGHDARAPPVSVVL